MNLAGAQGIDMSGGSHTCARMSSGGVMCWGANDSGQLGNGTSGTGALSSVPVQTSNITDAQWIATGGGRSCAVRLAGGVVCWGIDYNGDLGAGTTGVQQLVPAPVLGF
jgi:alpha-tubulin suppressor-like RCC1 family protein